MTTITKYVKQSMPEDKNIQRVQKPSRSTVSQRPAPDKQHGVLVDEIRKPGHPTCSECLIIFGNITKQHHSSFTDMTQELSSLEVIYKDIYKPKGLNSVERAQGLHLMKTTDQRMTKSIGLQHLPATLPFSAKGHLQPCWVTIWC